MTSYFLVHDIFVSDFLQVLEDQLGLEHRPTVLHRQHGPYTQCRCDLKYGPVVATNPPSQVRVDGLPYQRRNRRTARHQRGLWTVVAAPVCKHTAAPAVTGAAGGSVASLLTFAMLRARPPPSLACVFVTCVSPLHAAVALSQHARRLRPEPCLRWRAPPRVCHNDARSALAQDDPTESSSQASDCTGATQFQVRLRPRPNKLGLGHGLMA